MYKSTISQLNETFTLAPTLETKHGNLKNKPQAFFERELDDFRVATDTINKTWLEVSYMVSYRVARTGKCHTIVEDLILPAAAEMAGTILEEMAK